MAEKILRGGRRVESDVVANSAGELALPVTS